MTVYIIDNFELEIFRLKVAIKRRFKVSFVTVLIDKYV